MARKKIKLTDTTDYKHPKTFEEWVSIHGEPEYIGEINHSYTKGIRVEDCENHDEQIDTTGIITRDDKDRMQLNYKKFVDFYINL